MKSLLGSTTASSPIFVKTVPKYRECYVDGFPVCLINLLFLLVGRIENSKAFPTRIVTWDQEGWFTMGEPIEWSSILLT